MKNRTAENRDLTAFALIFLKAYQKLISLIYNSIFFNQYMSSDTPRSPTPSVYRQDPTKDFYGTLFPYLNMKDTGFTPFVSAFKRLIAPINPFAYQQVPTTNDIAFAPKIGERLYHPEPYHSSIHFDDHLPSHYDPMKDARFKTVPATNIVSIMPAFRTEWHPIHCIRQNQAYTKCLLANDDDKNKCTEEGNNILAICPPFALDSMRQGHLIQQRAVAFANKQYKRVMEVPEYNKGRTVADVPLRQWSDGEREKLRPDSMWADERYADITQKEIDEAKERVKKRNQAKGHVADQSIHYPVYDRTYEAPPTPGLYP